MKKVLILVFNNFISDSRVLKESISLKNDGFDVQILALHDHNLAEHENIDGIKVHRIKLATKKWPKIFSIQLIKFVELILKILAKYRKTDIVHCNDLNTLPVGYLLSKFSVEKIKIVYDAHEYETEVKADLPKWRKRLLQISEAFFIKYAQSVFTVSNSIANEYVRLYNIKKPILLLNCPLYEKRKSNLFREKLPISTTQKIFLYQGGFTPNRGIDIILETFSKLNDPHSVVVFMGYGILQKEIEAYARAHDNIFLIPAVPHNEIIGYASSADIGLLLYEDTCLNHRYCLPNKLFEYNMARLPTIVSNLPEIKKVVKDERIGWVLEKNNAKCLNGLISRIEVSAINKMKFNCDTAAKKYNWEKQEEKLLSSYMRMI